MRDEYDFSDGERGRFYRAGTKSNVPVYLDEDVLGYFAELAKARGVDLNVFINDVLKKDIALIESAK